MSTEKQSEDSFDTDGSAAPTDGETPDSQPVQGFSAFRGRALLGRGETDMEPSSPRDFPASCGRFSRPQVGGADRDRVGADRASMRYRSRRPADTTLQESALVTGSRARPDGRRPALPDPCRGGRLHARGCLALVADTSISGLRVARELDRIVVGRAKPAAIVSDNGTELTSNAMLRWADSAVSPGTTSRAANRPRTPSRGSTAGSATSC